MAVGLAKTNVSFRSALPDPEKLAAGEWGQSLKAVFAVFQLVRKWAALLVKNENSGKKLIGYRG